VGEVQEKKKYKIDRCKRNCG